MDLSILCGPSEPPLLHLTLGELVRNQAKSNGSRIAVASQHQDQSLSFAELEKRTELLAASLLQLGVKRGDRVAILLGNRLEYVEVRKQYFIIHRLISANSLVMQIFIASAKIGAIATLLNFAYTPVELHSALTYTSESMLAKDLDGKVANYNSAYYPIHDVEVIQI